MSLSATLVNQGTEGLDRVKITVKHAMEEQPVIPSAPGAYIVGRVGQYLSGKVAGGYRVKDSAVRAEPERQTYAGSHIEVAHNGTEVHSETVEGNNRTVVVRTVLTAIARKPLPDSLTAVSKRVLSELPVNVAMGHLGTCVAAEIVGTDTRQSPGRDAGTLDQWTEYTVHTTWASRVADPDDLDSDPDEVEPAEAAA